MYFTHVSTLFYRRNKKACENFIFPGNFPDCTVVMYVFVVFFFLFYYYELTFTNAWIHYHIMLKPMNVEHTFS